MFFPTLIQHYLSLSACRSPEKVALICEHDRLTYVQLEQQSTQLAHALRNAGIQRQDRVIIFMENSIESIISLYGILKAGAVFVIVNAAIKPKKLAYLIHDSGAAAIITQTEKATIVESVVGDLKSGVKIFWQGCSHDIPNELTSISQDWDSIFSNQSSLAVLPDFSLDLDLAALIYTSGSTGEPKGVMSTHCNMISAARSIIHYLENTPEDVILNVLPLSFDYGLYQVLMTIMFGGTVVIEKSFLYIHKILERIAQDRVTGFPIVPTILAMLLKLQDLKKYDFGSLRYISNTGAALPVEHIRKLRKLFSGIKIYSMFGLTECKRVCYLPPEEIDRRPASVGKAMPNCEVFILDEAGNEVKAGEIGELVVRGSNVMKGYWNAPEQTAKYFRPGRLPGEILLYSGDYFRRDAEAFLYFIGRKDEMIKSKGERLSAKEIENVICEIEGVIEAAVIGVSDEILGQAIKVFIVASDQKSITQNDVLKYCKDNLEPYAIPKYIEFVAELPKTAHGKIDKKALAG